jgi:hypothetical protein
MILSLFDFMDFTFSFLTCQELPPNPKHMRLCTIEDARKDVLPYIHEKTVSMCEIIAKSLRSYKLDHMIGMEEKFFLFSLFLSISYFFFSFWIQ